MSTYEVKDYLLIQDDKVMAVSGNSDFFDIDESAPVLKQGVPYQIVVVLEIFDNED